MDLEAWENLRPERGRQEIPQNFRRVGPLLSSKVQRDLDRTKIGPLPDFGRGVVVLNRHSSRLVISLASKFWNITADHSYFKIMGTSETKQPEEIYHAGWLYILLALSELFAGAKFVDSRISTKLEKYITWGVGGCTYISFGSSQTFFCQRQMRTKSSPAEERQLRRRFQIRFRISLRSTVEIKLLYLTGSGFLRKNKNKKPKECTPPELPT